MRIAIDARELGGQPTGVGRYLGEILRAWNALPGAAAHEFLLCAPDPAALPLLASLPVEVIAASGHGTRWEQLSLPRLLRRARADVLFAPGYTAPIWSPAPAVVTVHDVSFAAHPEWFSYREGVRRRLLTRMAARRAARVLTVSDFSKREIVRHLGIPADAVDVIYSGATAIEGMAAGPVARAGGVTTAPPLVLSVGSIFNRRHVPELIDACDRMIHDGIDARLEIVGDNRTRPSVDIRALAAGTAAGDRIRIRAYVDDQELASLYRRAAVFVFLSEYEGFGMTPLEALAAGVPIVVLDTDVSREIYGPAAIYVARPEPALIQAAIVTALFDTAERTRLLTVAPDVLRRYSWAECAHRTLQVLIACGRGPTRAPGGAADGR